MSNILWNLAGWGMLLGVVLPRVVLWNHPKSLRVFHLHIHHAMIGLMVLLVGLLLRRWPSLKGLSVLLIGLGLGLVIDDVIGHSWRYLRY